MTNWTNPQYVGYLPQIFLEDDPRTAQEQANTNYAHGGGWYSFKKFQLSGDADSGYWLTYPGDPAMKELSRTQFHNQTLVLFDSSWVAIIEADGILSDVARID